MTREAITRIECDRCGDIADLSDPDQGGWVELELGIVRRGKLAADLCPPCFAGLRSYLDGETGVRATPVSERHPSESTEDKLRRLWADDMPGTAIAAELGVSPATVYNRAKALGLPERNLRRGVPIKKKGSRASDYRPTGGPQRRHATPTSGRSVVLDDGHPASTGKRTLFPTTVVEAEDSPRLLISGHNQRKIGKEVVKGSWAGMPLYTLTLEERATCPTTCTVWNECYGNNMHLARRHRHGPAFEDKLRKELLALKEQHPDGFVVRLHILGDFYSLRYVGLWNWAMHFIPQMRIFGFTARSIATDIGDAILTLNLNYPLRCRIRYSDGANAGGMGSIVVDSAAEAGSAVVCPAQTQKTDCCATCGLCWSMDKVVAFLRHGKAVASHLADANA